MQIFIQSNKEIIPLNDIPSGSDRWAFSEYGGQLSQVPNTRMITGN